MFVNKIEYTVMCQCREEARRTEDIVPEAFELTEHLVRFLLLSGLKTGLQQRECTLDITALR